LLLVPILLTGLTLPGKMPAEDIFCGLALLLASVQVVKYRVRLPTLLWVALGFIIAGALLALVLDHPPTFGGLKRMFHLGLFCLLIAAIASARIRSVNLARAISIGLSIGLVTGLVGLVAGSSSYAGRLTGTFGDPNVASLVAVGAGMIGYHYAERPRARLYILVVVIAIVGESLSRTGGLALALALLWVFWAYKVPRSISIPMIVGAVIGALSLPSDIQTVGPFAGHAASNQLRALIDQASAQDMVHHLWTGTGPGTAYIQISNGTQFFFHNSYEAMVAEFGLLVVVPFGVLLVATAYMLFRTRPRAPAIEAGLLATLVMALTLGEVLLAFTAAIVLGAAWNHILSNRPERRESELLESQIARRPSRPTHDQPGIAM
jgi:hypothetical protein